MSELTEAEIEAICIRVIARELATIGKAVEVAIAEEFAGLIDTAIGAFELITDANVPPDERRDRLAKLIKKVKTEGA